MKILTVCCFYPPYEPNGGASIHAHEITKAYQNFGNEVAVFCGYLNTSIPINTIRKDTYENIKVNRITLNYQSFDNPIQKITGSPEILTAFKNIVSQFKPDLIHFHSIQGLGANIVKYAINNHIKVAVTCHDSWWICPRQFFLKSDKKTFCKNKNLTDCSLCYAYLEDKTNILKNIKKESEIINRDKYLYDIFANINYVIFPSEFIKNIYSKYFIKKNWLVSQNGIPVYKKSKTIKTKKFKFLYTGGNSDEKGASLLINTWQKYFSKNKNLKLDIYGNGSQFLSSTISAPNINIFENYKRQDVIKIFSNHKALIYPSIIPENSPVTIKEAFSFGIPVIGSNVGGIPELIKDGKNGYIFNNNNSFSLKKKISELINNKKYNLLKTEANKSVKTIDQQANEILCFIKNRKITLNNFKLSDTFISKLRSIYYHPYFEPYSNNLLFKILIFKKESLKITPKKIMLFNLDFSRKYIFDKYFTDIQNKRFTEIVKLPEFHTSNNYLSLLKNKYCNWLKIFSILKKSNIKTVVFPIPDIFYLRYINRFLFILFGIKYFIFLDKNIIIYKFQPKITINKNPYFKRELSKTLFKLLKSFFYFIFFSILVFNVIKALLTTKYGLKKTSNQIHKTISQMSIKIIIINVLLLPLKIIRLVSNYILNNYLIK